MAGWIDIHAHLAMLEIDPALLVENARKEGVERIICVGTEPADYDANIEIARAHNPFVWLAMGLHPHESNKVNGELLRNLRKLLADPAVVALGEIGLDFYYDHSTHDEQRKAFTEQMQIAKELNLPVQIHSRDAESDTIAILNDFRDEVKGVIHCFTGSLKMAQKCLDLGYDISLSGIVTFPKANELRDVASFVPLERLHVETDSPFLAPVPYRGKKNSSAWVVHTARRLALIKNLDEQSFSNILKENARRMFTRMQWM